VRRYKKHKIKPSKNPKNTNTSNQYLAFGGNPPTIKKSLINGFNCNVHILEKEQHKKLLIRNCIAAEEQNRISNSSKEKRSGNTIAAQHKANFPLFAPPNSQ
jgi:hypothetical protein